MGPHFHDAPRPKLYLNHKLCFYQHFLIFVLNKSLNGYRFEAKMAKVLISKSKLQKASMDYSCHGGYEGIHIVFSLFSLHSS